MRTADVKGNPHERRSPRSPAILRWRLGHPCAMGRAAAHPPPCRYRTTVFEVTVDGTRDETLSVDGHLAGLHTAREKVMAPVP